MPFNFFQTIKKLTSCSRFILTRSGYYISAAFLCSMLALVLTSGCSDYLNEKKSEKETIELKGEKFFCVNNLPQQFKSLGLGDADESSINSSFGCLQSALTFFNQRTRGSMSQAYTTEELRKFFGKYFLKENNISPELAHELMQLKKALFGGDDQKITKVELERLISLLGVLKEEIIKVNPHLKLLLLKRIGEEVRSSELDIAVQQLAESFKKIISQVDIEKADYSFEGLQNLASGLYNFIAPKAKIQSFENAKEWLPVFKAAKQILFGDSADLNQKSDWYAAIDSVAKVYNLSLKLYFKPIDLSLVNSSHLQDLFLSLDGILDAIESSFLMQKQGQIPFNNIDELIKQLSASRFISGPVQPSTWIYTYKVVISKFLDLGRPLDQINALTTAHFQSFKIEYENFKLIQKEIDSLFSLNSTLTGSLEEITPAQIEKYLSEHKSNEIFSVLVDQSIQKKYWTVQREDLIRLWRKQFPIKFTANGQNFITYSQQLQKWNWKSLTITHLINATNRFFIRGYGDVGSGEYNQRGLSEKSMIRWYDDFMKLGIELKFFDPRSANSGARSFKEANFFTPSGDGNKVMSYDESYEFLSNLFTAGIANTSRLVDVMSAQGCATGELDIFQKPYFNEACFKKTLRKFYAEIFPNLPYQNLFVKMLNDSFWDQYYEAAMSTSRTVEANKGLRVETSDIRTLVVVLHYIDNLFILFDKNANGYLDLDELRLASVRFADFVKEYVPAVPVGQEYLVQESFVAMVVLGRKPDASDLIKFKWDEKVGNLGPVSRINILKTFAALREDLKKVSK